MSDTPWPPRPTSPSAGSGRSAPGPSAAGRRPGAAAGFPSEPWANQPAAGAEQAARGARPETPITAGYSYERPAPGSWPSSRSASSSAGQAAAPWAPSSASPDSSPHEAIGRYAAPRRPSALVILLIAVAVVGVAALILTTVLGKPAAVSPSAPSPTAAHPSGGVDIDTGSIKGHWSILSQRWEARSVTVMVEISVDEGLLYYNMYGFSNQDGETIEPVTGGANSISYGYIAAGQTLTGTVTLPVPRQDVTLILSDGLGQALSALPIHS